MRKISKKILSIVLVICMLIPISAMMFTVGAEESSSIKVGDTITLGKYNGKDIIWVCVLIDSNGPLMMAKDVLCNKAYDASGVNDKYHSDGWGYIRKERGSSCWYDSSIRQWLNSSEQSVSWTHCPPKSGSVTANAYNEEAGFLTNFTDKEKALIKEVTRIVNVNIWETKRSGYCDGGSSDTVYQSLTKSSVNFKNYYYKNITDKMFLLNAQQYNAIYNSDRSFLKASTSYWTCINDGNNFACFEHVVVANPNLSIDTGYQANNGSFGVRPAFYLDLEKYEESVKGKFLEGYDTVDLLDKYLFTNQTDKISYWQCCKMFTPIIAGILNHCDDGTNGQCYGMATTTALFLKGTPMVDSVTGTIKVGFDSVEEYPDNTAVNIRDMWNGEENYVKSFISEYNISLDDFIKLAHISQYSASMIITENLTTNQYSMIIKAIEGYINGGEPIVISIRGDIGKKIDCGHSLLPVGIKKTENSYIVYVDDSNNYEKICELVFHLEDNEITGWSYEPSNWGSDKPNGKIYYSAPCSNVLPFFAINAVDESINNFFKTTYKLISTNNNNSIVKDDRFIEILSENGTSSDNYLYWADESLETLTISAVDKETEFSYCDDYVGISVVIPKGSKAECVVNDETFSNIIISDAKDNEVEISFDTATEDSQDITTITISGIATDNEVTATQTETGIKVTGIANGTITLKKNDEVLSTEKISCSDGNDEIEYDKTGTSSEVSAKYEEKHNDANNDGVCDDCNKVLDASKSCYCACHTNIIVKFVLMIIDAIFRAFGSSFDCACGMSHR